MTASFHLKKQTFNISLNGDENESLLTNANMIAQVTTMSFKGNEIDIQSIYLCFDDGECAVTYGQKVLATFNETMYTILAKQMATTLYDSRDLDELQCLHQGQTVPCNGGYCQAMIGVSAGDLKAMDQLCIPKNFLRPAGIAINLEKSEDSTDYGIT
ncbi:unnamed protein product, partial [Didymodactylos carnosus]